MLNKTQIDAACRIFGNDFCSKLIDNESKGQNKPAPSIQLTKEKQTDDIEELFFAESRAAKKATESKYAAKFFGCFEVDASGEKSLVAPGKFFGWQNHETGEKSSVDVVSQMFLTS